MSNVGEVETDVEFRVRGTHLFVGCGGNHNWKVKSAKESSFVLRTFGDASLGFAGGPTRATL